jgi:hypothetical protein
MVNSEEIRVWKEEVINYLTFSIQLFKSQSTVQLKGTVPVFTRRENFRTLAVAWRRCRLHTA